MRRAFHCALALSSMLGCSGESTTAPRTIDDPAPPDTRIEPDGGGAQPTTLTLTERLVTRYGALRGLGQDATLSFRGVHYAAPPIGPLRGREPAPPPRWDGERDARTFGEPCVQTDVNLAVVGSEDCLTLNVWTPARVADARLPVLVYLHGGDNISGSATGKTYDGSYDGAKLAMRGNVVVVTLNYRLAAFGFLAHPALASGDPHHASGNYGLLDQIAALRWVQENVAQFGGDPKQVLLFGQSAGSVDACDLVVSPLANGLFSRALMQSGACFDLDESSSKTTTQSVTSALGCVDAADVAACLRNKSADEVARAPGASLFGPNASGGRYYPVVDGYVLPERPITALSQGRFRPMPLVFGTNADEYSTVLSLMVTDPIATDAEYLRVLRAQFGDTAADLIRPHYPSSDYPSPRHALIAIYGD